MGARAMRRGRPPALGREHVTLEFLEVLRREPRASEIGRYGQFVDRQRLREELLRSAEYRDVVAPLATLIRYEWVEWMFREPTKSELAKCIARARHGLGSDALVLRAMHDGSIQNWMDFRPLSVELDITNQCNLRCVMCQFSLPELYKNPKRQLSVEKFTELASQLFHRSHQVSLSFGTEPLLHRDISRLFPIMERCRVPNTYMNTNALLLREPVIESMIQHGFNSLLVSVDAASKDTYERIRVGGSFDKLVANLLLLQRMKERAGVTHPKVALGFVLMRQNLHELASAIDFAAEIGAHAVNAMHMIAWGKLGNEPMGAVHEKRRCNEALEAARDRAHQRGVTLVAPDPFTLSDAVVAEDHAARDRVVLVKDIEKRSTAFGLSLVGAERDVCPFPWNFVAIDMNGNVVPCGWWWEAGAMGNIHEQDFGSIWRGERYQALRERHRKRSLEGPCARCPAAGMGNPDARTAFLPTAGAKP
jgi:radical SAM protein with 4Fe4S-binding SPASM domain